MKIDELIEILQRVKAAKGNIEVKASGAIGTNQAFVLLDVKPPTRKNFCVADHCNDYNQFCMSVEVSDITRKQIEKGVAEMKELGYRFFLSQYRSLGESPKEGLSPCDWHNPW